MDMSVNVAKSEKFIRWRRRLIQQIITLSLSLAVAIWLKVILDR
jgi:hypothetical protein